MAREMKDSGIAWIGEIPREWTTNTAFQLFTQVKNKNSDLREKNLLSLSYGRIKRKDIETTDGLLPESFDGYNIIEANDIVLRLTDLQNDQRSLRVGLATERGIVTSAYLTLRNRSTSLPKYLYYYLHAFDISKGFYGMGAGVRQGLNWDGLKWLKILSPSASEQRRIADFLDAECARIDTVIEKTRASIEEYKKLKQSVITQAVTKGIRPGRKMKDSGIEWIGEIPEEYTVQRIKHLGSYRNGLTYSPEDICDEEQGTLVLRSSNIQQGQLCYNDNVFVNTKIAENLYVQKGDIIICSRNGSRELIGKCAVVENDLCATFGAFMMMYRCDSPKYMYYILNSDVFRYYLSTFLTATINQLTGGNFGNMAIVYCGDEKEQSEIVAYLDSETKQIDTLIANKERLISELESYQKSLIFEYVTGKKEVPVA